ncbi:hypothetical protein ERHA55_24300 [Erwinia rhapontici]|uniref:Flagellar hook-associated protein 2 C-terminal domain-containing protein n=1 Tax=Erwinia rhapontici TaxID=55212 RepID=A0ABN6DJX9_ERWRD|nr:hypothetical protein [Erwinia rhapontici]BCQ34832.1 hypothetical protein ERHA53_21750 [Erwinia rhapontici]BCQ44903.1 hypothetical protein ERHA55_24300 [Erwinia rhapontici]
MTVISSVGNLSVNTLPGATKLATTAAAVDTLQTPPLSSTTVSLGQSAAAPPVYSLPRISTAATQTDNQGTLSVKTASGAEVELTQASDGSGVQIKVNKGTLSEAERSALEKLSDGFKKAMEGLTGQPPRLDLSGLTRFNSAVLTSVDLQAKVTGENKLTLAFHADTNTRSVKSTGTLGTVDISVDMSKRAILGNESQQQRALSQYLKQFDRAQSRGEGNSTLMTMFKDAFTALNSHYDSSTPAQSRPQTLYLSLTRTDKNMLTGLADFTASVTQTPQSPNPIRLSEGDTFSYQVSQTSTLSGTSDQNRHITQKQQSHLTASYHKALTSGLQLALTADRNAQNYFYTQIDDKAESTTEVQYRKGALVSATLDQSASTSTRVQKYVKGELMSDVTTPEQKSTSTDLLGKLQSAWKAENPRASFADYLRQHTLPDFGEEVLLNSDPSSL